MWVLIRNREEVALFLEALGKLGPEHPTDQRFWGMIVFATVMVVIVGILPLRRDFAERIQLWLASRPDMKPDKPLFNISGKRTADMIRKDLQAARAKWIDDAGDEGEEKARQESTFLAVQNDQGHLVDFHALRKTFITNLTLSGAAPKTAQTLARHSDINLTMNTYTMPCVLDQAAAVEALPPIPTTTSDNQPEQLRATGTDGREAVGEDSKMVPILVPRMVPIWLHRTRYSLHRVAPNRRLATERRGG